jgi:hypothetical protein
MRQDVADINATKQVVDLHDEPVLVSFDVADRRLADGVSARKCLSDACPTLPGHLFRDAKLHIAGAFALGVPLGGFLELLAVDYVEAAPAEFALCEEVKCCAALQIKTRRSP